MQEKVNLDMKVEIAETTTRIMLSGRFDFHSHRQFRQISEEAMKGAGEVEVDLGRVEYMDSSALGMLLNLRDKAKAASKQVSLVNCAGRVRELLEAVHFDRVFAIN